MTFLTRCLRTTALGAAVLCGALLLAPAADGKSAVPEAQTPAPVVHTQDLGWG